MRRLGVFLLLAIAPLSSGCKRSSTPGPAVTGDAGVTTEADAGAGQLTAGQVQAYVRYGRAMVDVYDALFRELEKLGNRTDGGVGGIPPQVRVVETKAQAEEKARLESGLTEAELVWIEPLVLDVLNARALAKSLDAQGQLTELKAMRDQLQGDAREGLEQTILELQQEQEEAAKLTEVRMKYGDANVDQVLAHERELGQNYELWLSRISGGKR